MNDREFQALQSRIQAIFESLRSATALQGVAFSLQFIRDPANVDCGGTASIAEIHPSWQYASATMLIFVPSFVDKDDDEIARVLLHELGHYLLHPISKYGSSPEYDLLEERACTDIARAIQKAMEASADEVAAHYRTQVKRLQKELKAMTKQAVPA